jgi:hypothetical protein
MFLKNIFLNRKVRVLKSKLIKPCLIEDIVSLTLLDIIG